MDERWWRANGRTVKGRLTRAERVIRTDPGKSWREAQAVFALMDEYGYPDWWSRVERLASDASWAINHPRTGEREETRR